MSTTLTVAVRKCSDSRILVSFVKASVDVVGLTKFGLIKLNLELGLVSLRNVFFKFFPLLLSLGLVLGKTH